MPDFNSDKLSKVLEQEVMSHQFTPDALNLFQDTIKQAKSLEHEKERLEEALRDRNETITQCRGDIVKLTWELDQWKGREEELKKRETEHLALHTKAMQSEAELAGYRAGVETIMRPAGVRRTVHENVVLPGTQCNDYTSQSETREVTNTEEVTEE